MYLVACFVSQCVCFCLGLYCLLALKPSTQAPTGLPHPVEIPRVCFEVWSMDFITDLPPCSDFNGIYTCVDKVMKYVKLIPVSIGEGALSALEVACLFFKHVVQLFDIPHEILHDRDAHFTAQFWHFLLEFLIYQVNLSLAYHPQLNRQTECTHHTEE